MIKGKIKRTYATMQNNIVIENVNRFGVDHRFVQTSENDRTDGHTVKATGRLTGKIATSLNSRDQVSSVKKQRNSISTKTGDTLTMENIKGAQATKRNDITIEIVNRGGADTNRRDGTRNSQGHARKERGTAGRNRRT